MSDTEAKVTFKSSAAGNKKQFRRRRRSSSDEEEKEKEEEAGEDFNRDKLQETLELQKLRQRSHGVSHLTLAVGKKVSKIDEIVASDDPFKLKSGGLITLSSAKAARALEDPSAAESELSASLNGGGELGDVGTQFSKETRVRDEDEEMRKFIESEMEKRRQRGKPGDDDDDGGTKGKYMTPEERALMSLPTHLRKSTFQKNEEMLSSQMLSGIPEVDLGIEEKIRNIEATEEAKKKLLAQQEEKQRRRLKSSAEFAPTNLAVNFKQPNRFKEAEEELQPPVKKRRDGNEAVVETQRTVVVGDVPLERVIRVESSDGGDRKAEQDKATDDLHLSKFKQHFHRK